MRSLLTSAVLGSVALGASLALPAKADASWLSQALHQVFDPGYYGPYYGGPAYGAYGPGYYSPGYGYYTPGYAIPYVAPYSVPFYGHRHYGGYYGHRGYAGWNRGWHGGYRGGYRGGYGHHHH